MDIIVGKGIFAFKAALVDAEQVLWLENTCILTPAFLSTHFIHFESVCLDMGLYGHVEVIKKF